MSDIKKEFGVSRRNFLTGAAATGAIAALGLAGCTPGNAGNADASTVNDDSSSLETTGGPGNDWLGSAPGTAEADIVENKTTDILIIGAGNAGMSAAATAVDLGIDFIICEKMENVQATRHWIGAVNTKQQQEAGVAIDTKKLLNELARYASFKCDQKVIKTWIDESAEMLEWIDGLMAPHDLYAVLDTEGFDKPNGGTDFMVPIMQHMYYNSQGEWLSDEIPERNQVLEEYINSKGKSINFGHTLVELVREGDTSGRVTGAIFETAEGYIKIEATKGVLLATGGYPANPDMIEALNPSVPTCVTSLGGAPNNDGLGMKTALWVGAAKDTEGAPMIFNRGLVAPGVDAGYVGEGAERHFPGTVPQLNFGSQPFLKVTRTGERFHNENTAYDFNCFAAAGHEGGVWCQVFDSKVKEDIIRFSTVGCSRRTHALLDNDKPIEEIFTEHFDNGLILKADTIEELAEKLELPLEPFKNTIDRYHELFEKQDDEDFGKESRCLSTISVPPFYGAWYGGSLLTTIDGLRINEDMQVLDKKSEIIEGLYAAGDVSGSFYSGNYPEYIIGNAVGRSITFGRHAIRHIAGDIA